jgi:cell division transport system permease protein
MFTILSRIVKYGILGFRRSGWLSAATIAVMVLTLLVFEVLTLFNVLTKTAIESFQDKIDISVYFNTETPEDEILKIKNSLESLVEVKKVEYISRDKALEIFRAKHEKDRTISEALGELKDNPLLASLNIKAYNSGDYAAINNYLSADSFKKSVSKISYAQNSLVIDRLTKIISTVKKAGAVLTILFAAVAVLITFNTIRLAIYSYREEIGIMRLVGASNALIQGPYVFEGVIYGLIAGILSSVISLPLIYYAAPYLSVLVPEISLWEYLISNFLNLLLYQIVFGIALGAISSTIAIRKYLKV